MKKIIFNLFAIGILAGFSNSLNAQTTNTASATSPAYATIVAPIGITHSGNDLQFGSMIKGTGTVTVGTNDARTFSTAALNPGDQGAAPTAAVFTVTGEDAYTYSIAFTNASETLTNPASNTMVASDFVALSGGGGASTGTLTGGTDAIKVGATLTLDNDETAGLYTGNFEVTVAYN